MFEVSSLPSEVIVLVVDYCHFVHCGWSAAVAYVENFHCPVEEAETSCRWRH